MFVMSIVSPANGSDVCVGGESRRSGPNNLSLLLFQLSSISKAINSTEIPVKEKHARRILNNKSQQNDLHTGLTW